MTVEYSPSSANSPPHVFFESRERRTVASYERELTRRRRTEIGLRDLLAQDEALLCQKDALIQQQTVLSQESDHRLLNGLQMIVSLLRCKAGRRKMLKLHHNWRRQPIALPRSGASTGGSTHWTEYKPSRSSNTLRTFVAISPSCFPRSAQSGPSSLRELKLSCRLLSAFRSASSQTN